VSGGGMGGWSEQNTKKGDNLENQNEMDA
jgi:hypothetical protein